MPRRNSTNSYGSIAKGFHWLTALLILVNIPVGLAANDLAQAIRDPAVQVTLDQIQRSFFLFSMHKTLGVAIFFVALARIGWALSQPKPGLLNPDRRFETLAADTVHWLLYGSLVLVPLSGWIVHAATEGFAPIWWPFGQTLPLVPRDARVAAIATGFHIVLQRVMFLALILHVAGALKHHLIDRDATFRRMLPGRGDWPEPAARRREFVPVIVALAIWTAALTAGAAIGTFGQPGAGGSRAPSGGESGWRVTDGALEFTFLRLGQPITGRFTDWTADIAFDDAPDSGPAGSVLVMVSIPSLALGPATEQALGPGIFDAQVFPTARFEAEIRRNGTGYEARGPLTLRGRTVEIALPFKLDLSGDTARARGSARLDRLDFGIGEKMRDESALAYQVEIAVDLTADRRR